MKLGKRMSVDQRIAMRNAAHVRLGRTAGWVDEALDMYLSGDDPVEEIARAFNVQVGTFYDAIAKAALFRMLKAQHVNQLEDCKDLTE